MDSTTACITYLSHGPVYAAGAFYKGHERIASEAARLWQDARSDVSNEGKARVFELFMANVLGVRDLKWPDLGKWLGRKGGADLHSPAQFRKHLPDAIAALPEGTGYKKVKQEELLVLTVGKGHSVKV